jgi:hypothetical protein
MDFSNGKCIDLFLSAEGYENSTEHVNALPGKGY